VQVLGAPECKRKKERLELPRIDLILSTPAGGGTVPGMEKTSRHASKSRCTAAGSDLAGDDPAPRRGRRRLCRRRALSLPVPARIKAGRPSPLELEPEAIKDRGAGGFWTTGTKWVLVFLKWMEPWKLLGWRNCDFYTREDAYFILRDIFPHFF
jgi:hypothetical protein